MAGRNGVFYDRQGRDWDATIAKVVDNPISIRQAFWSPYKRFVRLVEEQVAKRAATAEGAHTARMQATAEQMAHVDRPTVAGPPAPAPAPAPAAAAAPAPAPAKKVDVGAVAAISVAIAGIATFLSSVMATFLGLGPWLPLGILALVLGISVPSVLIAWLKLRQRNLGPILDANGWAVNGRVRVNVPFGGALTTVAALPPGSKRSMTDPYAEKRRPWGLYLTLLLILALAGTWYFEKLDRWLPVQVQARNVLGKLAPSRWMGEQKPAVPEPGPEKPK
jgi:hypothetical protein